MLVSAAALSAQSAIPLKGLNPEVQKIVSEIQTERIAASMKKLESFGTRNIFSSQDDPQRGVGAASRWIADEFKSYSPKLEVRFDPHDIKKAGRVVRDVQVVNVVAVLPGTTQKDRYVIVGGHYDSLNIVKKIDEKTGKPGEQTDVEATIAADAPGVSDDASGTAAVLELARVMSQHTFEKSIIFIAFSGEEYGLLGAGGFATKAAEAKMIIDGMFNNDIIGNDVAGNGISANGEVNVFSEDPIDSPARTLARFAKEIGERYVPNMKVNLVFRQDRFGRGGDHRPFERAGFPAIRFTTTAEFFKNQHSPTDTFANASPGYAAKVTRVNAAGIATLALAPPAPDVTKETKSSFGGEVTKGPSLGRGKSGYDAAMTWKEVGDVTDLAGFSVVIRDTTAPYWEKEMWVGKGKEFVLPDVLIDDLVLGIKAIDKDGNESPVAVYRYLSRFDGKPVPVQPEGQSGAGAKKPSDSVE